MPQIGWKTKNCIGEGWKGYDMHFGIVKFNGFVKNSFKNTDRMVFVNLTEHLARLFSIRENSNRIVLTFISEN